MFCINVAVWGCQQNYQNLGAMYLTGCFVGDGRDLPELQSLFWSADMGAKLRLFRRRK